VTALDAPQNPQKRQILKRIISQLITSFQKDFTGLLHYTDKSSSKTLKPHAFKNMKMNSEN